MRLVLDTNVVLDWLYFCDPLVAPVVRAIQSGRALALTCAECAGELRRVLAYPEFHLEETEQAALFARYCARTTLIELPPPALSAGLPRCRDSHDQKFLRLAWHGGAQLLITRDKALLALNRAAARLDGIMVLPPERFATAAGSWRAACKQHPR